MEMLCFKIISVAVVLCHVKGELPHEVLETIRELKHEAELSKKTLARQDKLLLQLQRTVETQSLQITQQDQQIQTLSSQADLLQRTLGYLTKVKTSSSDGREGNTSINEATRRLQEQNIDTVTEIVWDSRKEKRLVLAEEGPVAFHAAIRAYGEVSHIGTDQKIIFPEVLLNLGSGYHGQHGIFIAPVPGVYIFSTSVMSSKSGPSEIWVHLVKNGKILANAFAAGDNGHQDQGSITVTTQLATADEVWVALYGPADDSVWGNYFTSFTGCLVNKFH